MEYVFSNGVGKRKSSIARVTLVRDMSGKKKGGSVTINNLTDEEHLQNNPSCALKLTTLSLYYNK